MGGLYELFLSIIIGDYNYFSNDNDTVLYSDDE
jgi:hypothetical protein